MGTNEERDESTRIGADADKSSAVDDVRGQLERSGERLQEGRRLNLPGDAELPARSLAAIAIFIVAFVVVYILCWVLLGTIGLAIGLIVGLVAGALAVKLYADRAGG